MQESLPVSWLNCPFWRWRSYAYAKLRLDAEDHTGRRSIGYLVINRFVRFGCIYCETEVEPDSETISADLTSGQFDDPVRAAAFDKHWAEEGAASLQM